MAVPGIDEIRDKFVPRINLCLARIPRIYRDHKISFPKKAEFNIDELSQFGNNFQKYPRIRLEVLESHGGA